MADGMGNWWAGARRWIRSSSLNLPRDTRIGLALGGGFARGIAHVGVLRVFEQARIPIHYISGVSSGSIVAAAFASGCSSDEIESAARSMRFSDVARWTISKHGLMGSDPMIRFLGRILKVYEFEKMKIPLAVVASDLSAGAPAVFRDKGDVLLAVRGSSAYPGLFQPVRYMNHCMVDGLMGSDPMIRFLGRILKVYEFEKMKIPLAVVASDLSAGAPAVFRDKGDVVLAIRASCAYPGLFQPVRYMNHCMVDGMITMDVPAAPLRRMGATHVVSVSLPAPNETVDPQNMLSVVTRCFQIMTARTESQWRRHSNLVISPEVKDVGWNSFESAQQLVAAGERAARAVLPQILRWFPQPAPEGGEAIVAA